MKKYIVLLLGVIVALALFQPIAWAGGNDITCIPLCYNVPLSTSGVSVFEIPYLNAYKPDGFFSIQIQVAGSGSVKIEYLLSATYSGSDSISGVTGDGSDYSNKGTDIVSSYGEADGMGVFSFASGEPPVAKYMAIMITEDSGTDPISGMTAYLCYQ